MERQIRDNLVEMVENGLFFSRVKPMPDLRDEECRKPSRCYLAKLFISKGADPNLVATTVEHTPLHWLAFWGDYRACKVVLNLNEESRMKRKPRFWEASNKDFIISKGGLN